MKLVAPNGKPTNLTPEQYRLVRTPAFKNWFGDWENSPETSSKVVDENGEPRVMYHGSLSKFTIYDIDRTKLISDWRSPMIFVAYKKSIAEIFGKQHTTIDRLTANVYEFFVDMKNPFDIFNNEEHYALAKKINKNILLAKNDDNWFYLETKEMMEALNKEGFDGAYVTETVTIGEKDGKYERELIKSIGVLNPTQIKLADGSNTTFDGSNPDIRFEKGGLIAPNGKISNLNETQYKLVRTPEFKAWFGDWEHSPETASKVVDENGEPVVCYHGSNNDFNEFRSDAGHSNDRGFYGRGFYFTFNTNGEWMKFSKGEASYYGSKVKDFFIKSLNPFDISKLSEYKGVGIGYVGTETIVFLNNIATIFPELANSIFLEKKKWNEERQLYHLKDVPISVLPELINKYQKLLKTYTYTDGRGETLKSGYVKSEIVEYDYTDSGGKKGSWERYDDLGGRYSEGISDTEVEIMLIVSAIEKYDGINANYHPEGYMTRYPSITDAIKKNHDSIMQTKSGDELVVFEPNQIKLADGTNTTFDDNNRDIRFGGGGLIIEPNERIEWNGYKVGDVIESAQLLGLSGVNEGGRKGKKYILIQSPLSDIELYDVSRQDIYDNVDNDPEYMKSEDWRIKEMKKDFDKTPPIPYNGDGLHRIVSAKELGHKTILMWKEYNPDIRFSDGGSVSLFKLISTKPPEVFGRRKAVYKKGNLNVSVIHSDYSQSMSRGSSLDGYSRVWENNDDLEKTFKGENNIEKSIKYLKKKYNINHNPSDLKRYNLKFEIGGDVDKMLDGGQLKEMDNTSKKIQEYVNNQKLIDDEPLRSFYDMNIGDTVTVTETDKYSKLPSSQATPDNGIYKLMVVPIAKTDHFIRGAVNREAFAHDDYDGWQTENLNNIKKTFDSERREPIIISECEDGLLTVIDGHHRLTVANELGRKSILALVREYKYNPSKSDWEESIKYISERYHKAKESIKNIPSPPLGTIQLIKSVEEILNNNANKMLDGGQTDFKYYLVVKNDKPVFRTKFTGHNDKTEEDMVDMLDKLIDLHYELKPITENEYKEFKYNDVDKKDLAEFTENWTYFRNGGQIKRGNKIEFRRNRLPRKDIYEFAKMVKEKYPKVWAKGGNIFGNEAFVRLERVIKRGYWLPSEEWMQIKWQSYIARHHKDFRIEGVVAMLKWIATTDKGWRYMKNLLNEEIEKQYPTVDDNYKNGGQLDGKCSVGTKVQSLIFSKDDYSKQNAKDWAESHGYKYGDVDEKENTYRLRQADPKDFVKGIFRTIEFKKGIKAIIACPKN